METPRVSLSIEVKSSRVPHEGSPVSSESPQIGTTCDLCKQQSLFDLQRITETVMAVEDAACTPPPQTCRHIALGPHQIFSIGKKPSFLPVDAIVAPPLKDRLVP